MRDSRIMWTAINEGAGGMADGFEISVEEVKQARSASGLTQAEAAKLLHNSINNWQNWEQGRYPMMPALFELFLLKTGQYTLREMVPMEDSALLRLRLRNGRVVELAIKNAVLRDITKADEV
jgi:transcriptional regulator with XRE-family HTH domain